MGAVVGTLYGSPLHHRCVMGISQSAYPSVEDVLTSPVKFKFACVEVRDGTKAQQEHLRRMANEENKRRESLIRRGTGKR